MIRNIEGFSSGFGVCLQEKAIIPHLIIGLTKHVVITLFILTVSFNQDHWYQIITVFTKK